MPGCVWSYGTLPALIKSEGENRDLRKTWVCFLGYALGFGRLQEKTHTLFFLRSRAETRFCVVRD